MNNFQRINNIAGWLVFVFASFVYLSTIEPTGSFWDCGEFIACAYKLQVGHPPGAPLFMILGRVASIFAGDNVKMVSVMINSFSAVSSAIVILFLFWSITHFARKLVVGSTKSDITMPQIISSIGAGIIGSVAYTFSDSFWFSAVEGEVYATSAAFTAIVFWAILKWEHVAEEKHSVRWIILIAYLMGLSIGVHLLNLLTIPALAFVYYFKRYKFSWAGFIKTGIISVAILGFVQVVIISYYVKVGSLIELMFVNSMGLPFWSGFLFFNIVAIGALIYGIYWTQKNGKPLFNTALLSIFFILIGYSTYALIVIRSAANPPLDENDPENVYSLLGYLGREQYGDFPLSYGQYYDAEVVKQEKGATQYVKGKDKYIPTGNKIEPVYDPARCTIFPRMWSNTQEGHVAGYKDWGEVEGDNPPDFSNNIKYFWRYQVIHMYWRYFMWNFVGRQNGVQGHGGITKGNWISGIPFIDSIFLGPQDNLPKSMTQNKARNMFFFLPLVLGLIGFVFQLQKNRKDFMVVFILFFMTGMAIILYLNQTPYQPRERDYAYAGSFYAFAIWIGLGVLQIAEWIQKKAGAMAAASVAVLVSLPVPYVMGAQGWDDHDRSYRYTSRDFATDYLNSCAPNAILFTNGDNDTFPLWYAQEVEGVRTDVRIVNLSLLNTDWYADQMKRQAYNSPPVPFKMSRDKYIQGTRDYIPYAKSAAGEDPVMELKDVFDFITSDDPRTKHPRAPDLNYLPTKRIKITVDKNAVLKNGVVAAKDSSKIVNEIVWEIPRNYVMKADLLILDLLAHNDWSRPIYFAVTVGSDGYMGLENYFQLEGLTYRFVPVMTKNADGQIGRVGADQMYANMMNKFSWGNMKDDRVYLDQNNLNMTMNFRNNFARLSEALLDEGLRDSSIKVLDKCMEEMPDKTVPFNMIMLRIVEMYYRNAMAAEPADSTMKFDVEKLPQSAKAIMEKGNMISKRLADIYEDDLNYYVSLNGTQYLKFVDRDINTSMMVLSELARMAKMTGQESLAKDFENRYNKFAAQIRPGGQ